MHKLQGGVSTLRGRWSVMAPAHRRLLMMCVLAVLALAGTSAWWSSRTDWRTLYTGLESRDAAQLQQQLSAAGILFQTTPDGTAVEVPAEQLDKARVAIAAKGMPQSGRLGFELFDKPNWVGSEFDERVNYQRALEGELEHTIETMEAIRSARVHVVLPKQGAFSSEDQPAKASAVLKLRRLDLPRQEADSIRAMVAGAVEGLQASAVTLVDADGRTDMSARSTHGSGHEDEAALEQKIISVLEPLAGAGNVHATVSISYAEGTEEHTDEVYDPSQSVPVSLQKNEQTAQSTRAAGIAGTASNTPAAVPVSNTGAGAAAPVSPIGVTPAGQTQTTREESSSYAVTRHEVHTEEGPGRVRRVTAAVVVNDRAVPEGNSKNAHTLWKPRSADEMHRLELLAQAAVGFDGKRGDTVALQNIAFSGNGEQTAPSVFDKLSSTTHDVLRSQPSLLRSLGMGLCLLLIGTMVLKPITRQANALIKQPVAQLQPPGVVSAPKLDGSTEESAPGDEARPTALGASTDVQKLFDQVSRHVKTEPQQSARLIESWIGGSEEADA